MKTELLLSINAKATSNRLGTPHRELVPPTTLNKLIPHEKISSLVQANSSKKRVQKGESVQMKGGRVPYFAFDLILCAVILFCDMDGINFSLIKS